MLTLTTVMVPNVLNLMIQYFASTVLEGMSCGYTSLETFEPGDILGND